MPTIVLGTDLSDNARAAARWAFGLARAVDDANEPAHLLVTHIIGANEIQLREVIADHSEKKERAEAHREVEEWLDGADINTEGVDYETNISIGRTAKTLSHLCEDRNAAWLVVGKSGRGRLARLFVGSTAEDLALRPPCPLVIVDPDDTPWQTPLSVVSAFDLTDSAAEAFVRGADIVRWNDDGGKLTLVHIISIPHGASPLVQGPHVLPETLEAHLEESRKWARDEIDELIDEHGASLDDISPDVHIRPGYPIHEILATIDDEGADLLTLGSKGRSRLAEFMLGGIGRSVLKRAPCSVLLAPPERRTDSHDEDNQD